MKYNDFLSTNGKSIFTEIVKHCKEIGFREIDTFEVSMLANSFDLYSINAKLCKDSGTTQKPESGGWDQLRPAYVVMKNEYQNILKHSAKFGLNPGDRERIFKGLNIIKKKKGFNLTGDPSFRKRELNQDQD